MLYIACVIRAYKDLHIKIKLTTALSWKWEMDRDIATKYYDTKWFEIIISLDNCNGLDNWIRIYLAK